MAMSLCLTYHCKPFFDAFIRLSSIALISKFAQVPDKTYLIASIRHLFIKHFLHKSESDSSEDAVFCTFNIFSLLQDVEESFCSGIHLTKQQILALDAAVTYHTEKKIYSHTGIFSNNKI
jgi:hypothetical protein